MMFSHIYFRWTELGNVEVVVYIRKVFGRHIIT